jgi:predicted nucleic-acid-binding protein
LDVIEGERRPFPAAGAQPIAGTTDRAYLCLQLVVEVVQQLSRMFQPEMRIIKKQIETLIDREYLVRDEDKQSNYKYVA